MTGNLALWKVVEKTDPAHTTKIVGKPYKGDSPKPYWLIHRATEVFGPIGIGWGFSIKDQHVEDGAPGDRIHIAHVEVWYKWDGEIGRVEHIGGTMMAGKNKNGPYSDDDAAKKSVTDALVKALSMIGFAGDIFMGRFDDNKYQAEVSAEFREKERAGNQDESMKDYLRRCEVAIIEAKTPVQLKSWWNEQEKYRAAIGVKNGTPEYTQLFKAFKDRGLELSANTNILVAG